MQFKQSLVLVLVLMLSACGGGGDDNTTETGAGSAGPGFQACTEENVYGQWRVTATANGLTESDIIIVRPEDSDSGKLTLDGNNFVYVEDGITLEGTINNSCSGLSGTFSGNGISGTWSAVKL